MNASPLLRRRAALPLRRAAIAPRASTPSLIPRPVLSASCPSTSGSQSRTIISQCQRSLQRKPARAVQCHAAAVQKRWESSSTEQPELVDESKVYNYEDLKKIVPLENSDQLLIDAREPHELADGYIPSAHNIPIVSQPSILFATPEEFEDAVGFPMPSKDTELIFYCKAGVRSRAAARLARQAGWTKTGEYPGSWVDWVANGGKIERSG